MELWPLVPSLEVLGVALCLTGVEVLFLVGVTTCPVVWILRDFMMRLTLELTSNWKAFSSLSNAVSLLFTDVFVVTDRLEVEDVEDLVDDPVDLVVADSVVFAFLFVVVAISVGGARLD